MWIKDAWLMILFATGLFVAFFLFMKDNITKVMFVAIIGALVIIDIGIVDYKIVQPDPNSGRASQLVSGKVIKRYFQPDKITKFLTEPETACRVYPVSPLFGESRLQAFGIESVGGYHPAKLAIYNKFLSKTNNISTLPLMRMMNIRYILSPQVVNHPDLEQVFTDKMQTGSGKIQIWVYRISHNIPRAWFVDKVEVVNEIDLWQNLLSGSFDPAQIAYIKDPLTEVITKGSKILEYDSSIHHIQLKTTSQNAGFLVISEVHYPLRWKARIDGKPVKTFETNGIIRGIEVPAGEHNIELEYDRLVFQKGILISILSFILAIGLIAFGLIRNKKINELV